MYLFLKKRHGIQSMIAEVGYNLMDALRKYQYDPDCSMFLMILENKIPEEVRGRGGGEGGEKHKGQDREIDGIEQ